MRTGAYLSPRDDLARASRAGPAGRRPGLRQRLGDPRPRARLLRRPGGLRARHAADRARERRRPDLPAPSRGDGAGGRDARRGVGRPLPSRHRAQPPALDGGRAAPRHGPAARRDARVRGRRARRAHRARPLRGRLLPGGLAGRVHAAVAPAAAPARGARGPDAGAGRRGGRRGGALALRAGVHPDGRRARARPGAGEGGQVARRLRGRGGGAGGRDGRRARPGRGLPRGAGPLPAAAVLPDDAAGERLRRAPRRVRPRPGGAAAGRGRAAGARGGARGRRGPRGGARLASKRTGRPGSRCRWCGRSACRRRRTRGRPWKPSRRRPEGASHAAARKGRDGDLERRRGRRRGRLLPLAQHRAHARARRRPRVPARPALPEHGAAPGVLHALRDRERGDDPERALPRAAERSHPVDPPGACRTSATPSGSAAGWRRAGGAARAGRS